MRRTIGRHKGLALALPAVLLGAIGLAAKAEAGILFDIVNNGTSLGSIDFPAASGSSPTGLIFQLTAGSRVFTEVDVTAASWTLDPATLDVVSLSLDALQGADPCSIPAHGPCSNARLTLTEQTFERFQTTCTGPGGTCQTGLFLPTAVEFVATAPSSLTLTAVKDSFLRKGAPNRNEGANPGLRLQAAGDNRVVIGFDRDAIDGFGEVSTATLVLTIAENADNWGMHADRTVDAHPLQEDFAEGNGQNGDLGWAQSTRGDGPGVTWNCATDADIGNHRADCDPKWSGGDFGAATAVPALHVNGMSGEVSWDVTDDVLAGTVAWLVKKTSEVQPGKVSYFSREGAEAAGNQDLAPRLILERTDAGS